MKKQYRIFALTILLCMTALTTVKAQRVAFKTDALKLALSMPNLGVELALGDRYSIDLTLTTTVKPYLQKDAKMFIIQPELRYWLSGRQMARTYIGVGANVLSYKFKYDGQYHDGYGAGAGITIGYSWLISSRWSIEAYAGFGLLAYQEKRYLPTDTKEDIETVYKNYSNANGYKMMPSKIGVAISYILR